ncbi:MAG: 50S ribosomal protein L11 [Candidatus Methanomethylicia archaeon]|uniref:Large ribosomal subunit protein uL11 n=1 Tax=Thermoproteota archaeon TaxID=2056631 RepID=A0A523BCQ9_9CREN|nr:50S ribosomal protein L11 [Candidatus Methanomethylicia archaeon]MCQ5374299.1 50S ribosomal protein L11 [Candidatus Methanomethylicia archaeon]NHV60309.1 50S ribosomal protein L11 [Candidatus Verstraetearchaeota archaeon]TDA38727.1 MAG: 50S ribosomal protein L11 [Candidatus Verstraetearchaeota archaeon]
MGTKKTFNFLVDGGKATGGPPIGPSLGPIGLNILQVVNTINEKTKEFEGMKVPVKVIADPDTKEFEVEVGVPTTTALIVKELKLQKCSSNAKAEKVGDLSIEAALKIAKTRYPLSVAKTLKSCLKEVLGTCVSIGVTVAGKDPREVQKEIDSGVYDDLIKKMEAQ